MMVITFDTLHIEWSKELDLQMYKISSFFANWYLSAFSVLAVICLTSIHACKFIWQCGTLTGLVQHHLRKGYQNENQICWPARHWL